MIRSNVRTPYKVMEQFKNRPLYSKPESRALLGTQQIMFNVGHAINRIETSNQWFFGFAQSLFDNLGHFVIMEMRVLYSFQQCLFLLCIFLKKYYFYKIKSELYLRLFEILIFLNY